MIRFNHDAEIIYEAIGFPSKEAYIETLEELKSDFETRLKEKDDKALIVLAYRLSISALVFSEAIPAIDVFFSVLMNGVKISHVVELLYKKLQMMEPDDIVKVAKKLIIAEDLSVDAIKMMKKGALMTLMSDLFNNGKDNKKDDKKE